MSEAQDLEAYRIPGELAIEFDAELDTLLEGEDLEKLEATIKQSGQVSDAFALYQGIGIVKIEREGLWMQAGFKSLQDYRIAQGERLDMPRSTIARRRRVAEGYLDNRKLFAGRLQIAGNVEKLALLSDALARYDKKDVLAHFKADSYRDFNRWVYPAALGGPALPDVSVRTTEDGIELDGVGMVAWEDDLPDEERFFIAQILKDAYRARRGNMLAHVVPVYDEGEARAVELALKRIRAAK